MVRIAFYDSKLIKRELEKRARKKEFPLTAKRHLSLFYELMDLELKAVNFTQDEALCLVNAFNGVNLESSLMPLGIVSAFAGSWEKEEMPDVAIAVLAKLKASTPTQLAAIHDAVIRFWYFPDSYFVPNTVSRLKEVGLCK